MPSDRKLAAILSADVAGYSRLMADDERATIETLNAYRQVIRERVERHGGRVVDSPGDALLAEFSSPVEAVDCAQEVQGELARRNEQLPEHRRMRFRIGINLGDVIVQDGALYGDGVNIAARLETLADAGGLCISGTVFDQVEGKLPLQFQFIGEQQVKNIAKPVRAYRVAGEACTTDAKAATTSWARRKPFLIGLGSIIVIVVAVLVGIAVKQGNRAPTSKVTSSQDPVLSVPSGPAIAVLPFQNMSGDPKQEFFADGIAEEIISGLSRFSNLRVLARNSTFQYKGKAVDIRQIGHELGATYVIEGSVRKAADTVRVTVQLLTASNGAHVWTETYERALNPENLFAVQDDIVSQVVARVGDIHGAVNQADIQNLRTRSAASLDDYECVLLTYEYQRFLTPDKHANVKACLTHTVEHNPDYADAWANLAYTYVDQYWGEYEGPPDPLERAYRAARRALELNPTSQIAHFALANVYFFQNDLDAFFVEADKALALNPNNTEMLASLGVRFTYAERRERGLALIAKATALNPSHPGWYWFPVAFDRYRKGEYPAALDYARRVDMPGFWYSHLWLAATYGALGERDHGQAALKAVDAINPAFRAHPLKYLRMWFKSEEAVQQFADGLRKAGLVIPDEKH